MRLTNNRTGVAAAMAAYCVAARTCSTNAFVFRSYPLPQPVFGSPPAQASSSAVVSRRSSTAAAAEDGASGNATSVGGDGRASQYIKCAKCQAYFRMGEDMMAQMKGKGRRVECSVCTNSWFQSRDRLFTPDEQWEMVPFEEKDVARINENISNGRPADFCGVAKLYVGNLSFTTSEDELENLFSEKGTVGSTTIVRDETGRSKGFGFITMLTEEDGAAAITLDGYDLDGRNLMVKKPREN